MVIFFFFHFTSHAVVNPVDLSVVAQLLSYFDVAEVIKTKGTKCPNMQIYLVNPVFITNISVFPKLIIYYGI